MLVISGGFHGLMAAQATWSKILCTYLETLLFQTNYLTSGTMLQFDGIFKVAFRKIV